jgi:propanediol dehydratase large subunit
VVPAHGSLDVAEAQTDDTAKAGDAIIERGLTAVDVVRALAARGYDVEAERVLEMTRQRLFGDHLQTSAIFGEDMRVLSALTDPNDYQGPGTGYRMSAERQQEVARVRQERSHAELLAEQAPHAGCVLLEDVGPAAVRPRPDEVVIGISPAFGVDVWLTLSGNSVGEALRQMLAGIEEEGVAARVVRVTHSLDLGMIGWTAANLSGSGIGLAIQGKGTALIHRADLPTLANLELLSVAPLIDASRYRALGRNAARHARGDKPAPVLLPESGEAMGPRYHAKVVALITREAQRIAAGLRAHRVAVVLAQRVAQLGHVTRTSCGSPAAMRCASRVISATTFAW